MRLNLYWRGRDVIDIEAHLWRKRVDEDAEPEPIVAGLAHLPGSELADDTEPDTYVHVFGFTGGAA